MPRFFSAHINGQTACIEGDDAKHIASSLRMRIGDTLVLCDMAGSDYDCVIRGISTQEVTLDVLSKTPCTSEPGVRVHLYQAIPKGDKLDMIVQKAVELGVYAFTPVLTERCVSRPD
ncbi:MAG: RsmE family RNA methyltransferase, partial [Oscillospiraceae bacterium]|nr:RsmE family RNA methyltransferase [Oscillospiraceae bacterium]